MQVKLYSVSRSKLNSVPIVNGQIIVTDDVSGYYYDMGGVRHHLQAADDVLFSAISASNTTSTGPSAAFDYTITSGSLGGLSMTACPYESLEFVFYDRGSGTQFSARLHGLPYGDAGMYTYNWCNKATACMDVDTTQSIGDSNIYRETVYATAVVTADGTFKVTSKTHITETVSKGVVTMAESDVSSDNRVGLLKIVGRR